MVLSFYCTSNVGPMLIWHDWLPVGWEVISDPPGHDEEFQRRPSSLSVTLTMMTVAR
jgi:hypothetical protein